MVGQDGNGDGQVDPQQVDDAALTTAVRLCRLAPNNSFDDADLEVALTAYNPTPRWAEQVTAWVNYYRKDDVSAIALFYLDQPTNGLPPLQPVEQRMAGLD